jgi:hypothetical protein
MDSKNKVHPWKLVMRISIPWFSKRKLSFLRENLAQEDGNLRKQRIKRESSPAHNDLTACLISSFIPFKAKVRIHLVVRYG